MKHNMALLGSNHVRNNAAAQDAKDGADTIRPFFYCGLLPNAKKNPLMKRSLFFRLMPL